VSRKDPRRVLMVPLEPALRDRLRAMARGRSMGDQARVLVGRALEGDLPDVAGFAHGPCLPVQMPKRDRARLEAMAQVRGLSPEALAAGLLAQALEAA